MLPLSHKKQKIKLTKKSVLQLFEFVRLRRPELIRTRNDVTSQPAGLGTGSPDSPAATQQDAEPRQQQSRRRRLRVIKDSSSDSESEQ
eukprot:2145809-Pleurochrysis_carterae.AAC.1